MPKKTKVSREVLELAMEAAQKAKTADDLRMPSRADPGLLDVLTVLLDKCLAALVER